MATVPFIFTMIVTGALTAAIVASLGLLIYEMSRESVSHRENKNRLRQAEDRAYERYIENDD